MPLALSRSGPNSFISHNNKTTRLRGSCLSFLSVILLKKNTEQMSPGKIPDPRELIGVPDVDRNGRHREAVVALQAMLSVAASRPPQRACASARSRP